MPPGTAGPAGSAATTSRRAARRAEKARAKAAGERRSIVWRMRRVLFLFALLFVLVVAGAGYLFTQVPLPDRDPPLLQTSFFCDSSVATGCNADNSMAQLSGGVDRITVEYDQLPPVLVQAVLAAEDRTFFEHGGVDPAGIVRALWANFRSDSVQQGGSTITQQYVKNVYLTQERTITRKIKEAALAVKLERELPKQEILTRYLNTIYFGRGAYGVEAASRAYFDKSVGQLDLNEAAYLAGLIRAPETADAQLAPDDPKAGTNRSTAVQRRNSVLKAMVETGDITQEVYDEASVAGWDDVVPRETRTNYGTVAHPEWGTEYFVEYVRRWLTTEGGFTDADVYGGGLRVYTTLDMQDQGDAVDAITSTLNQPDDPSSALVSIDDQGAVRAMVGGLDYNGDGPFAKVNLAVGTDGGGSGRQPGSSFKPFVLAEAMRQHIPLAKTYNAPAKLTIELDGGEIYEPENYSDAGLGVLNLVQATQKSSNTAYVQLMQDVGPDNVVALAHEMGVTAELDPVLSLALGSGSVSVLDMASGYSTLADNGQHIPPYVVSKVTDAAGNILYENQIERTEVLTETEAQEVNWALNQVIEGGTGTGAKISQPAAGKTGTTDNYRDAWFNGFTCKLTTAVWVGYPGAGEDGQPRLMESVHGKSVTGGSLPATIWQRYMTKATEGLESCPFEKPDLSPAGDRAPSSVVSPSTTRAPSTTATTAAPAPTTTRPPSTTTPTTAPPSTTTPSTSTPSSTTTPAAKRTTG